MDRPPLLDRHYYFVNGCVAAPGECAEAGPDDWGEYYAEMRLLYEEAAQVAACEQAPAFEEWAAAHTHFITSQTAADGASSLVEALHENTASSDIHVVGTSAGGAAVFTYLSQAMRGEVPLDRRIRSVMTVDSPLGYQPPFTSDDMLSGLQAGSMKTDVQSGIGEWAKAAGISMLTIDTRQDIVGYDPLPHVANDPSPTYPQGDTPPVSPYPACRSLPCRLEHMAEYLDLGSVWHTYTGSHMAESARQFAREHWR
jgi:pimeloyl-ACP methyl ester carboxylesterase